jgi:Holliday junction resolvase RusA-like endonuclease
MESGPITPHHTASSLEGSILSARIPCKSTDYATSVAKNVANGENGIVFFVPGIPAPAGSKRFVGHSKKTGRAILVDMSGERGTNWRIAVQWHAQEQLLSGAVQFMHGTPLDLRVTFTMPRPKHHFRKNGELKQDAPLFHTGTPDTTKLLRAVEDAITGILWHDDSQVAFQCAQKIYGTNPGAQITIYRIQ